ncbi:DNA-binding transcriptional LysR family regulator [Bradyrhizobium japonicum]
MPATPEPGGADAGYYYSGDASGSTAPRFLTVPALVARAPVVVTMHARLARLFATELKLSLSQPPVDLQDVAVSLLWHASYDHDPSHAWLRQILVELVSEL